MSHNVNFRHRFGTALVFQALVFIGIYFSYQKTKHFMESECRVIEYQTEYMTKCKCDDEETCVNGYAPCLKIFVAFMDINSENRTAMLYLSDLSYFHDEKCTYPSCDTQKKAKDLYDVTFDDDFLEFVDTYTQIGKTFDCFYNPQKDEAIIRKDVTHMDALLSLFFFALYLIIEVIHLCWKLCNGDDD